VISLNCVIAPRGYLFDKMYGELCSGMLERAKGIEPSTYSLGNSG